MLETHSLLSQLSQQTPNEPLFSKRFAELILQRLFKGLWTPKSLLLPPAFGAAGQVEIHPFLVTHLGVEAYIGD